MAVRTAARHSSGNKGHPPASRRGRAWLDWLIGTDPGLMRLEMAAETVLAIGVVLVAEWVFVRATGALQVPIPAKAPPATAAELWAFNHALVVTAMLIGVTVALSSGMGMAMFGTVRRQVVGLLFLPFPLLAAFALGLVLHVRPLSLAWLAVVLAIGTYCRRFGPLGFNGGVVAFIGAFIGFFIQGYVTIGEFGWLAAEVGLAVAATIVVHLLFFFPRPAAALRRMQQSHAARNRAVAGELADLYRATVRSGGRARDRRAERKLQCQLLRLNEAALLIDARLDNPAAIPAGWSAAKLHQWLFDAEVGLSNVARFALTLARLELPAGATVAVRRALTGLRDADAGAAMDGASALREFLETSDPERSRLSSHDRVLLHRFATSVTEFTVAIHAFRRYPDGNAVDDAPGEFRTQVATLGGWLPGSAFIAGAASKERGGPGLIERIGMAPYARYAIQVGIAAGGAIVLGDRLSGQRFYWALLAVFITFMGTSTAGEQVRKSAFRIAGTLVGVIVGSVLGHLVGDRVELQIVVVLISMFLGLYLMRVNYTFMGIGMTVMVSQLYVELDEFSNSLLLLRLEETALGAAVAMAAAVLVLPLGVGRVARVAARQQLTVLADLIDRYLDRLADAGSAAGSDLELRAAARRVDTAYQTLVATVAPMRASLFGGPAKTVTGFMATVVAARNYARNLPLGSARPGAGLSREAAAELLLARRQFARSIAAVTAILEPGDGSPGRYVRSASLFARIADRLPEQEHTSRLQLALRDLQFLDGALAEAARGVGVPVTDLDTATPGR
ncbi:MAG TPA: FUSC family protein [Trebonia sp.]